MGRPPPALGKVLPAPAEDFVGDQPTGPCFNPIIAPAWLLSHLLHNRGSQVHVTLGVNLADVGRGVAQHRLGGF